MALPVPPTPVWPPLPELADGAAGEPAVDMLPVVLGA
jgi:hypothetical protein